MEEKENQKEKYSCIPRFPMCTVITESILLRQSRSKMDSVLSIGHTACTPRDSDFVKSVVGLSGVILGNGDTKPNI
eukprot:gene12823-3754_t